MSTQEIQTLAIIGQGYVGLPLAMAAVDAGWTVIGINNFEAKVSQTALRTGRCKVGKASVVLIGKKFQ